VKYRVIRDDAGKRGEVAALHEVAKFADESLDRGFGHSVLLAVLAARSNPGCSGAFIPVAAARIE
jgi:hypothetical protein